jgi:hypothetical protein
VLRLLLRVTARSSRRRRDVAQLTRHSLDSLTSQNYDTQKLKPIAQQLQAKRIPADVKSVFSNSVPPGCLPALERLLEARGVTQRGRKLSATLHLVHRGSSERFGLALAAAEEEELEGGGCSGEGRCGFVCVCVCCSLAFSVKKCGGGLCSTAVAC